MKDFPLCRSLRGCLLGCILVAGPLLALALAPMVGFLYVPMAEMYLLPTAICLTAMVGGAAPLAVNTLAGLAAMYLVFGMQGLTVSALYLLPIVGAFVGVIRFRVPFWKACAVMIGVHLLCLAGIFAYLQAQCGGQLYAAAGRAAMDALEKSEFRDSLLYQFYSMGVLSLPDHLAEKAVVPALFGGGYVLSAAAREDLLLSASSLVTGTLTTLVPSAIVSQSILGGVACLLLPLRFGFLAEEKRAFLSAKTAGEEAGAVQFPDLGMPPLYRWYIPRGYGWQVGLALIAGYFLRRSAAPAAAVAGTILYTAATALFTVQGAALINFIQRQRNSSRAWRVALPLLLMAFSVLTFAGIFDQIVNIRGLRAPREPKEGF